MTLYGYARVSSTDQDLSLQEAVLRQACSQDCTQYRQSSILAFL